MFLIFCESFVLLCFSWLLLLFLVLSFGFVVLFVLLLGLLFSFVLGGGMVGREKPMNNCFSHTHDLVTSERYVRNSLLWVEEISE